MSPSSDSRRDTGEPQIHAAIEDPDDPFGSRLDEKPPAGWDDRFWDEVRTRIEDTPGGPDGHNLPDPGRWRRRGARALGAAIAMLCAAGLLRGLSGGWIVAQRPAGVPPTVVSVVGSDHPDVAVDWARLNGLDAGFTVFRSIDPDLSYVYLDSTLPALARHAAIDDIVPADHAGTAGVGLIRMFRGRLLPSSQEVEVTTFFRDQGFSPLAGTDGGQGDADMEQEIGAHARSIFSLGEVTSLGSGRMELHGGAVVFDDGGSGGPHATRLTIEGRPVGRDAARLLVLQSNAGREVVATSVVARRGRTIILAGGGRTTHDDLLLVAFTLL